MTIRKGEAWGTIGRAPADVQRVHLDRQLVEVVERSVSSGSQLPTFALLGGDLMRAVGGSGNADRLSGEVPLLPVDLVRVDADDGRTACFAAHLVARRTYWRGGWWRGEVLAAMNGQYLGRFDVAPRAHPNDGRFDLVRVSDSMSIRDRLNARRRLPQGIHVPHPDIEIRQTSATTVVFDHPMRIWLDGKPWGSARSLTMVAEPDAVTVCV